MFVALPAPSAGKQLESEGWGEEAAAAAVAAVASDPLEQIQPLLQVTCWAGSSLGAGARNWGCTTPAPRLLHSLGHD